MRGFMVTLCVASFCTGDLARADHQPAFVVPGRSNIPVPINGMNAAWGIVNGDVGLYRPGAVPVTVLPSPYVPPLQPDPPVHYRPARHYYPTMGRQPLVGRLEVEPSPNQPLPKPPKSFNRSWSAESPDVPPTQYPPSPPMMVSPEVNFGEPWGGGGNVPPRPPFPPRPPHRR